MRPFLTLHHPRAAKAYYDAGLWQGDNLYGLLAGQAAVNGDRIALVDGRRSLTWQQLRAWVDGIAADLRGFGLVGGDRVCIWMSNRAEAVAILLACSREGFVANPSLHRNHTCDNVLALMRQLDARALFTEASWGADRATANFDAGLSKLAGLRVVYDVEYFPEPQSNLTAWNTSPDNIVYLAFTSGTTGEPKCVMHSDNTLLANARELVRDWKLDASDTILTLSPLSHHIAWVAVCQWLLTGCRLIVNDPPAGRSTLDWLVSQNATYVMGVPTHAIDILAEQARRGCDLGAVRTFYMAGATIPPSVCEAFLSQGIKPQNVYGMTENSSHQYTHPDDDQDTIIKTCGRGGGAYEIRLFDPADPDTEVRQGEIGQIAGRGAALMLGYFGNQGATEASFNQAGWFMSGDLGVLDTAGNLSVVGRLKDIIIRGGHNIYPAQIEALALRHPAIDQVACFPIPDKRLGERACIAIKTGIDEETLLRHLKREGLSRYDMPEFLVRLDAFPMTASGKVLKRRLIEMVRQMELVPEPITAGAPAATGAVARRRSKTA